MINSELQTRYRQFLVLLYIDITLTAITALGGWWGIGVSEQIEAGRRVVTPELLSTLNFWDHFGRVTIFSMIAVGIGLGRWLDACYSFGTSQLGVTGFKYQNWTWAGWLIPFFNLFRPYQVINEIYKAGSRSSTLADDWKKSSGSGLLVAWWIFYVVAHLIVGIAGKQIIKESQRSDMSLQRAILITYATITICAISILVSVLWLWVGEVLTSRLRSRNVYAGAFTTSATSRESSTLSRAAPVPNQSIDTGVYARIASEIESGETDKGLWTFLYSESGGDETKTKAAYIRQRAIDMSIKTQKGSKKVTYSKDEPGVTESNFVTIGVAAFVIVGLLIGFSVNSYDKSANPTISNQMYSEKDSMGKDDRQKVLDQAGDQLTSTTAQRKETPSITEGGDVTKQALVNCDAKETELLRQGSNGPRSRDEWRNHFVAVDKCMVTLGYLFATDPTIDCSRGLGRLSECYEEHSQTESMQQMNRPMSSNGKRASLKKSVQRPVIGTECINDAQCSTGLLCILGGCSEQLPVGASCLRHMDCKGTDTSCKQFKCAASEADRRLRECEYDGECLGKMSCQQGRCRP